MSPLLRAGRTAAIALALVAIQLGVALHVGADVLPTPPSGQSSTSASSTPTPTPATTPCPTDITGVICQAAGGPTPTPTPTPTAAPTATPKPTAAPTSAAAAGAAIPPPSSAPPAGKSAPGPHGPVPSAQTVAQVAANFRNAPFLGQLLDILKHPVSAQRPDLHHFRPSGGAGGAGGTGRGGGGGAGVFGLVAGLPAAAAGGSIAAAVAVALLASLLAGGLAVLIGYPEARVTLRRLAAAAWRLHPSLHRIFVTAHNLGVRVRPWLHRLRVGLGVPRYTLRQQSHRGLAVATAVATLPALVVAAVLAGAAVRGEGASLATAPQTGMSSYLRSELALGTDAEQVAMQQAPASWVRLVTIERGLAAQQDELSAQEGEIDRLVINLSGHDPDSEDSVAVGPSSTTQQRNSLASLVAAHVATLAAYQQSLQAEYDLYRAAAQDPAQRAQLTAAVATQQPQVKDAVAYNLSLLQTQLSQEATIAAAEAKLAAIGSLTGTQLSAMRGHQPFIAPLVAPVTQVFGPTDFSLEPPLSYNGTFYPHFHTGLDLGAPLDTPVHAAADGVVLLAQASVDQNGKLVGYGNYVAIAHPNGFVTLYGHLDSIAVKAGQVVHQGEIIGLEGSTGWSTGPHVHFEIRHDGQFLDPAPYLAGQLPS